MSNLQKMMMLTNGSAVIDVDGGITTTVWGVEERRHLNLCCFYKAV